MIEKCNGLDKNICNIESNLSLGQRQLFALGQAILKMNKILIFDEAKVNIDPKTEFMVQKIIRERFTDCTVLTIAHRLHTIMDYDKILVINDGMIVEFDSPQRLMENPYGAFKQIIQFN